MESLLKINLLTGETRTVKAHDGTTMQDVIDLVVSKFRAINKQFFALQISRSTSDGNKTAHWIPNNYTLPDINQRYPSDEEKQWTFNLMVRFLPNNIQHLADTDIITFNYFYEQVRAEFFSSIASQMETEVALQLGCLEMRRHFKDLSPQALNKKSNLNMLEHDIGFSTFFPPMVLNSAKKKDVRKAIQTNFKQYTNLTENQCVYKFFEVLSKTRQIFTSVYNVCIGGDNTPLVLNVGPLHGISYKQGDTLVRIDFAGIRAITVEPTCTYQTRVVIIYTLAGLQSEQLNVIAPSLSTALDLASLVDGYCIINTSIKESRISPDSEGAPRSARKVLAPSRAQSMYNRHSFNGPIPPSLPPERGSTLANEVHRRSCFDIVSPQQMAPTFIEEEPDYALADNDWFIESSSIDQFEPIGEGQFGAVFRGMLRYDTGEPSEIAIKTLKAESTNEERDKFLNEAYTMKRFNHPHIIELLGVVIDKQPPWIVMELAEHGELRGYLHKKGSSLSTGTLLQFTIQVCSALEYLECNCKIVHRDVAARNVLVFSESVVKLADFGLSRYVEEEGYYKASKGRLPIKWMAPESINFRRFTSSSDVWMFGVCIWELFMLGIKPFRGIKNSEVISRIEVGERLAMPELMPPPLYQLIMQCWDYEPSRRPKFSELILNIQSLIDEEYTSGKAPPTKPPRPSRFTTGGESSSLEAPLSTFSSPPSQIEDRQEKERQALEQRLEAQRAQSQADDLWLRSQQRDSQHLPEAPTYAATTVKKPLPKLDIDRNTDTVYLALTSLIQKIMEINQIIDKVRADDFQQLVQTVGISLRALLSAADTETARLATTQVNCESVNMAQKVLLTDMKDVIASMQEAKQLSATTLDQEYRRKLLSRVHALAKDGKSLLEAVDMARALSTLYSPMATPIEDFLEENHRYEQCSGERARPHSYTGQQQPLINSIHTTSRLRTDPYDRSGHDMMVRRQSAPEGAPS